MKVFAGIRLGLWACLLGVCIVISGLYLTVSQTVLKPTVLQSWTAKAHLAETIRDQVIAPRIVTTAKNSEPAGFALLPPKIITDSLRESMPADQLDARLAPATAALARWLDSKSSDVSYSINIADLRNKFFDTLGTKLTAELAALPDCTSANSYNDVQNGICAYDDATSAQLQQDTLQAVKDNSKEVFGDTITEASGIATIPQTSGISAPDALNILSSAAWFTTALLAIGVVWLLLRKRGASIVTIGAASIIGGVGLFVVSSMVKNRSASLTTDSLYQPLLKVAGSEIANKNNNYALLCMLVGIGLLILGSALLIFLRRRKRANQSMHFHSTPDRDID